MPNPKVLSGKADQRGTPQEVYQRNLPGGGGGVVESGQAMDRIIAGVTVSR